MTIEESRMAEKKLSKATFAGGCFWCMEPPYAKLNGVKSVMPGYTGGKTKNPTYEEVCSGESGHAEAVQVFFDPAELPYERLLDVFWRNIDPTTRNGQFADMGTQYRTAIYYHDEGQKRLAEASKEALGKSGRFAAPIVTEISPAAEFYPAEEYHQCYYQKNPVRYQSYRAGSGREGFLKRVWGSEKP
jgi:methionine-S-sulfoxide reductase